MNKSIAPSRHSAPSSISGNDNPSASLSFRGRFSPEEPAFSFGYTAKIAFKSGV
jgi:hypothetical protein